MTKETGGRPKVVYYDMLCYQPDNLTRLDAHFDLVTRATPADDTDDILVDADACFAPLGYMFDGAKMDRSPDLKAILSNTTGVPHIDMEAAAQRNIQVLSLKDEQEFLGTITPTSEHTWGLLLALLRNTGPSFEAVCKGKWNRRPFPGSAMLSRLSLGIVGYGRLGKMVARYGLAFGMTVRYYDPFVVSDNPAINRIGSLEELVSQSDVISLHIPALQETYGLVSREIIKAFKPGSYFINTARGEVVDEQALCDAFETGQLAGIASDVLDGEFDPGFVPECHPLVKLAQKNDKVLLTPHIGGSTLDAWRETEGRVIDKAIELLIV